MLTFTDQFVNIILDGNSNIASSQITDPTKTLTAQLSALAPLSGNVTITNMALGGATWELMLNGNDYSGLEELVDAFRPGKQNLMFVMETFNQAANGGSTAFVLEKCKAYITYAKTLQPQLRVFLMTCPAAQDNGGAIDYNAVIDECNAYMRTNYADLGAEGLVELRPPGGPFDYQPPYNGGPGKFTQSPWYQDAVHWSPAGVGVVAQYIADYLPTIPDVAPPPGTGGGTAPMAVASGNILLGWL